ncbi:hypothetical protein [Escherichia coli]|uniref:hypothetical protein n=1 Tax=Escherichia coli TaxID=562 RepID=UPI000E214ED6|nr:hypothetical protein [Escherichia coli]
MAINLAKYNTKIKSEAGVEVEIVDPETGKATGVTIKIIGPDSKKARDNQKRLVEMGDTITEQDQAEFLAELVIGWKGVGYQIDDMSDEVEELPLNKENVLMLLNEVDHIAPQIASAFRNRKLFMRG